MVIWISELSSSIQVLTLIVQIKLYKCFIITKYKDILPRLHNKKWTKARIYSCRACDGPETKYILLKHEYHNKHSNRNIQ